MNKSIGVFDSGYGGLTILAELKNSLPAYDFLYLGDNARAPYGNRSFDVVFEFTLQAVEFLFQQNCDLVILACNTASAKALRTIQQTILPYKYPTKKVLGVIRPTTEILGNYSSTKHIGLLATEGTVTSNSYKIEIEKFFPDCTLVQHACPIWVSLIENNLHETSGGKWFIQNDLQYLLKQDGNIDTILLACTHYPIIESEIKKIVGDKIKVISQGKIVAESLKNYLNRHPEIESNCTKKGEIKFCTTENELIFNKKASLFFRDEINSMHVKID